MHVPVGLHTLFEPHDTPGPRLPVESLHAGPPGPHVSTPFKHAVGLVAHDVPAVQATHTPVEQTFPPEHIMPSGTGALSTHGVPPSHDVRPVLHGAPAFVVQTSPGVQLEPAGWQVPFTHSSVPVQAGVQPLPPSVPMQTPLTQVAPVVHAGVQPPTPPSGPTQTPRTHWFVPVHAGVHELEPPSRDTHAPFRQTVAPVHAGVQVPEPPSLATHVPSKQTSLPVQAGEQSFEIVLQSERHVPSSQQVSPSRHVPSASHLNPTGALPLSI